MNTCHYCGFTYHPMPVYTLRSGAEVYREDGSYKPQRIHVCHIKIDEESNIVSSDCRKQAEAEGYIYRRDLTPRR